MKTALLLLAIICCAALTRETCIAEPPSNPASEQVASGNREKTIDPKKTLVGVDLRQTKAVNDPTPRVRSSAIVPLTKSSPKNLRSHGPSPAIIGGPATAFRNTAAINGTAVKRKP
jgi:hypothetical protein